MAHLSPTNANDWGRKPAEAEPLPNDDRWTLKSAIAEKAEPGDVKVTNKGRRSGMAWIGVPLNKASQITLLPDGEV